MTKKFLHGPDKDVAAVVPRTACYRCQVMPNCTTFDVDDPIQPCGTDLRADACGGKHRGAPLAFGAFCLALRSEVQNELCSRAAAGVARLEEGDGCCGSECGWANCASSSGTLYTRDDLFRPC